MNTLKMNILKSEKQITIASGVLIALGFVFRRLFDLTPVGNIFLIISTIVAMLPIGIKAWSALMMKVFSIELLVSVAVIGALYINEYVESSVVTFLFLFGAYLEARSLHKTRESIKELTEMAPDEAEILYEDGTTETIDVYDVEVGDRLIVKQGGKIPVDGHVVKGEGSVNQAAITGESVPVTKNTVEDRELFSGTIVESGYIEMIADKESDDSTFAKIIELVEEAQDSKSDTERFLDRFSQWYTPAVIILAVVVLLATKNIHLAITVLVTACPGALVIGAPVSNVAGIGNGAKNGVLFKGGQVVQSLSEVDTLVFDKTGTLTNGKPEVTTVIFSEDIKSSEENYILSLAREVETVSEHHLGRAVIEYADKHGFNQKVDSNNLEAVKGRGVRGLVDGREVLIGNKQMAEEAGVLVKDATQEKAIVLEKKANTVVYLVVDKEVVAIIAIADKIRDEAKEAIKNLRAHGIKEVIMMTGDNRYTADAVAKELGIDKVYSELKPEDKVKHLQELQNEGKKVAMTGDGVNDAPAIALADVGVAMGTSGTDVSIETADLVLMRDDLNKYAHAVGLAKATMRNMVDNIFIALAVVSVLIAGVLFGAVSMAVGMFVHEASILVVIFNAMRLNKFGRKK